MTFDIWIIAPECSLVVLAATVLMLDLFITRKAIVWAVSLVGLLVPLVLTLAAASRGGSFLGSAAADPLAIAFKVAFLVIAALTLLASYDYSNRFPRFRGEFFALILTAVSGMMLLSAATELVTTYIALETMSISFYALAGFNKDQKSTEASLKYLLLGAISSAILLYGMTIVYGLTGATVYSEIAANLSPAQGPNRAVLIMAVSFLVAGFGFKVSAVPFQMWTPDVYEGAPTPITALLSVGSKAAAFAAIIRLFTVAFAPIPVDWAALFAVLAVLTMTFGNLAALAQTNVKRLLAYSSIGQAGYILIGVSVSSDFGRSGVLFYLLSYAFTNLGAFAAVIAITNRTDSDDLADFAGMARRSPVIAALLTFCLISLTGIPPTAGFVAKIYIFSAAAQAGLTWLVVVGVLNSAVSAYYYLKIVRAMYLLPGASEEAIRPSFPTMAAVVVASLGVLLVFVFSNPLFGITDFASRTLRGG